MHKIKRFVNMFQNLQPRLSALSGISHEVIKSEILEIRSICILAMFSLRVRRNVHFGVSGKNSDISVRLLDPDFLIVSEMSAI